MATKLKWEVMRKSGDKTWYQTYLRSRHWRQLRKRKLSQLKYKCEKCAYVDRFQDEKRGYRLHLHHLTYERVGHEALSDLQGLCARCHRAAHRPRLLNLFSRK
jgi:5-methylcytosine-specific restriction endonuclease McrA